MSGTHVWNSPTEQWVELGSPAAFLNPDAEHRTPGEDHGNGSRTIGPHYTGLGSKRCNVCGWWRTIHADADERGEFTCGQISISHRTGETVPEACAHCRAWSSRFGFPRYYAEPRVQ